MVTEADLLLPSLVQDELVNRLILQKRLAKDGHEVVIAVHGGDALRLLKKDFAFDLILMVRLLRLSAIEDLRLLSSPDVSQDLMMPVRLPFPSSPPEVAES